MLNWLSQFNTFCFLDNHQYQIKPHTQECLVAAGVKQGITLLPGFPALEQLQSFIRQHENKWIFGHLNYDLKNELEQLRSGHPDRIGFPELFFFEPAILIRFDEKQMVVEAGDPDRIVEEILQSVPAPDSDQHPALPVKSRLQKEEYIATIQQLQQHILRGDCYEINYCQEFFSDDAPIDPVKVYRRLSDISPNPFSALYRLGERWLLCASPERFLKKEGSRIMAQPIKGTSKRMPGDHSMDEQTRQELYYSGKDRAENVMIVDLMRNDLSKICTEGSVTVEELYGIYSFPQVHQMISTISGELKSTALFSDIIRATFPMGSMTGAPKRKVMQLIEQYEKTRRGIFSGTLGYISPGGDFDFNVIIRSIMYNHSSYYLSFQTGSGITFYSDPAKEWEECMVKAEAMKKCLGDT